MKTTMMYYLTPVKISYIKNIRKNFIGGDVAPKNSDPLLVGMLSYSTPVENSINNSQ